MFRKRKLSMLNRSLCGLVGVIAIAIGLFHSHGDYSYRTWFGGLAFAPVAAVLGTVALLGALFNWRRIWDHPPREDKRAGTKFEVVQPRPLAYSGVMRIS